MIRSQRCLASGIALLATLSTLLLADEARAAGKRRPGTERGPNKIHSHRLANGMTVLVEQDFRAPLASFALWYGVGSRDDPNGKAGLASVVMRMMTHGTVHVPDGAYSDTFYRIDARESADYVYPDTTVIRTTVPSNRVAVPMWLWSDQMGFFVPAATDDNLARQKESLKVEWKHKVEGESKQAAYDAAIAEVFGPTHVYRRGQLASPAELDALQLTDIKAFHQKWYVPNNAVLAVSGLVEPKAVFELADKYFGPIPAGPANNPVESLPVPLADDIVLEAEAAIASPEVGMYWPTPGIEEPGDFELDVFAEMLSGQMVSWLTWRLVDEQKIADRAWAHQNSKELGSFFHVHARVSKGHTPEEVVSSLDAVVADAADKGLKDFQIRRAANSIIVRDMFWFQRPSGRIARYASCQFRYADPDCLLWRVNRLDKITTEEVRKAASDLKASGRVILIIRPNASAPVSGRIVSRQARKHS